MRDRDDVPRLPTLGERLTAAGTEMAGRHLPVYPWAAALGPVLRRAAELNESWAQRFERHEAGGRPPVPDRPRRGHAVTMPDPATDADPAPPADALAVSERPLPVDVRARLETLAGPGAAVMRVLTGPEADTTVRGQRADAVTVGTDVRVRSELFRPDTPQGMALLAHEASHVTAALRRAGTGQHAVPSGAQAEEHRARQVERAARQSFTGPALPGGAIGRPSAPASSSARPAFSPAPGARPPAPFSRTRSAATPVGTAPLTVPAGAGPAMRADTDRTEAAAAPPLDLEALRHELIEELMRRVRTDFERGG
jgi:hypothetical protein